MYKIIILALLFLPIEKSNSRNFIRLSMQISDALPVQFWLIGCATYNEHQAPGVFHKCFYAPWECDDNIRIQFTDSPSQDYSLEIYDLNDSLLGTVDFEEVYVGVYEVNLNLNEDSPDVCDQQIRLKIRREVGLQSISLPDLSTWQYNDTADVNWNTGSPAPWVSLLNDGVDSELLWADYAFIPGVEYTVYINYTASGGFFNQTDVSILDSSFNVLFQTGVDPVGGPGAHTTNPLTFTATSSTTKIGFFVSGTVLGSITVTLNSTTAVRTISDSEIVAQTDYLDIRQNHEESVLLTYSNHRNFAGLVYQNTSPNTTFEIRIPAIFFHQRFPEEDEVMELSSELVTLNGTVRKQRRLDTDYVPYYFHEKLKLILKHQSLQIFNREWVKQEAYEIAEGNRLAPLKAAKCWLSEKDFVHRNIL